MDAQEQEKLIEQFTGVTGTSSERARFFLECAEWNSDLAIENFYDNHQEDLMAASESDDDTGFPIEPTVPEVRQPVVPSIVRQPSPTVAAKAPPMKTQSSSRIATFESLRRTEPSSDEEEQGQAFYAGGSESGGGQQILGPKKKTHETLVADMFKNAKEHGAEVLDPKDSRVNKKPSYFQGAAYRLGGENDPGGAIPMGMPSDERPPNMDVVLRFWRNGFSVDSGPLRDFQDPENLEFLDDVRRGKIPRELVALAKGSTVTLDMEDHSHEDYVRPKVSTQAFSGQGHRLGNPTDGVLASATLGASGSSVDRKPSPGAKALVQVDQSLPVTNIQIRLPDGSRLVSKFNHTHTVSDVRQYIIEMRPNYSQSNFVLMTTFPNREITDESATLSAANLINTVLVVRIK